MTIGCPFSIHSLLHGVHFFSKYSSQNEHFNFCIHCFNFTVYVFGFIDVIAGIIVI